MGAMRVKMPGKSHFGARLWEPQHFEIQAASEWGEILLVLIRVLRLTEPRSCARQGSGLSG
jgi:hypothetical protein